MPFFAIIFIFIFIVLMIFAGMYLQKHIKEYRFFKEHYLNSQQFMNSLPGFVSIFNENLQYYDCNDKLLEILKMKREDLINKPLGFIHYNNQFADYLERFNLSDDYNQSFILEDSTDFSNEKKFYFCVLSKTTVDQHFQISAVCIDITELHLKEKTLEKRRIELFELEKLMTIGELASGLSHEINNPLAIISGRIQVLLRKIEAKELTNETLKDVLGKIVDSTSRINRILRSLKIISKDSPKLEIRIYKIQDVIDPLLTLYNHKIFFHCIFLTVDNKYPAELILCDLAELSQVVLHLIKNTIESIKNSSDKWMRIEVHYAKDKIQIWFVDSGNCLSEETQLNIFMPFYKNENHLDSSGISLFSAREMMLKQNGNLTYNNNHPQNCFVVELPIAMDKTQNQDNEESANEVISERRKFA